jgi:hypothetical protein
MNPARNMGALFCEEQWRWPLDAAREKQVEEHR